MIFVRMAFRIQMEIRLGKNLLCLKTIGNQSAVITNTLRFFCLDAFVLYYLVTQSKINISLFEAISELSLKKSLTTVLD